MIIHQVLDTVASAVPMVIDHAAPSSTSGDDIAGRLKKLVAAPIAVIIGLISITHLVGQDKSIAKFITWLLSAVTVFGLIMFGENILNALGELVKFVVGADKKG